VVNNKRRIEKADCRSLPTAYCLLPSVFCLLLTAFCLLFSSCSHRGALLDRAQAAWDKGDYAGAAARYEEFLKDNPRHEQAEAVRFQTGNVYYINLRQYDRAIQHYIHLLEDFPRSSHAAQARQRLAESYVALGKLREAVIEYENLLSALPNYPERRRVRLNIADLYYEQNDLGQALAEYSKVTTNAAYDELTERAYLRIGGINFLRDEFEEAIAAYRQVAEHTRDPQIRRQARFSLADCFARTFQYDEAVKTLEETEKDPQAPDYIPKRIAQIREQQRARNLSQPEAPGLPGKR
jgi:tetratricopeptide (TPR) repeat protein